MKTVKRNCAGCRRQISCNVKDTAYKCKPEWYDPIKKVVTA